MAATAAADLQIILSDLEELCQSNHSSIDDIENLIQDAHRKCQQCPEEAKSVVNFLSQMSDVVKARKKSQSSFQPFHAERKVQGKLLRLLLF